MLASSRYRVCILPATPSATGRGTWLKPQMQVKENKGTRNDLWERNEVVVACSVTGGRRKTLNKRKREACPAAMTHG